MLPGVLLTVTLIERGLGLVALEAVDELHARMGLSLLVDLVHMASGSRIGDKELFGNVLGGASGQEVVEHLGLAF